MQTRRVLFSLLMVTLALVLILIFVVLASGTGAHLRAQAPTPAPNEPLVFRGSGSIIIPAGRSVFFSYPFPTRTPFPGEPTPRGLSPPLSVENRSDQPIVATSNGNENYIFEAEDGFLIQVLSVGSRDISGCRPTVGPVVRCEPRFAGPVVLTVVVDDAPREAFLLPSGCTNTRLTWSLGTPLRIVVAAIEPPEALESIWTFVPSRGAIIAIGFSPAAPAGANNYTSIRAPGEAAFLCLRAPATLTRPLTVP